MEQANCNINEKIWIFVQNNIQVEILVDFEQQITIKLKIMDDSQEMMITYVYAKYDSKQKMNLWGDIYIVYNNQTLSWLMRGDFNAILDFEEKIGGLLVYPQ